MQAVSIAELQQMWKMEAPVVPELSQVSEKEEEIVEIDNPFIGVQSLMVFPTSRKVEICRTCYRGLHD